MQNIHLLFKAISRTKGGLEQVFPSSLALMQSVEPIGRKRLREDHYTSLGEYIANKACLYLIILMCIWQNIAEIQNSLRVHIHEVPLNWIHKPTIVVLVGGTGSEEVHEWINITNLMKSFKVLILKYKCPKWRPRAGWRRHSDLPQTQAITTVNC